ncbi:uncharacterized protein THITE_129549 [Thermothielavioides terrestris NRRL 8126]|uniref:F-box domain-containing protein n=1 Tax=Thermothielavioides terrestris (strain ATCC 38088 / NRRL 8126) TaxID=578455 RepID=G2QRF5_THETT|nr:uncharacterized protein THITE_129549 [Thermothielavioides terrestris NRRL 8126]AEO62500.1 hypothetical protein THITE_129549 [Thermothielavioides terrestris NRRL 8126]
MSGNSPSFLTLPLELRLEIYTHLLVLPPPPPPETLTTIYRCSHPYTASSSSSQLPASDPARSESTSEPEPTVHPQILRVNRQIHHEATPLLYTLNTFLAHPAAMTALPTLYSHHHQHHHHHPHSAPQSRTRSKTIPITTPPRLTNLITRWHVRLRLDAPPPPQAPWWDRAAVARAFTGAEALTLEIEWGAAVPGGAAAEVLRVFEGVRGVRRVRIAGAAGSGLEGYVAWLRARMMMRPGGNKEAAVGVRQEGKGRGWGGETDGEGLGWKVDGDEEQDGDELREDGNGNWDGDEDWDEEYVPADETERNMLRRWMLDYP